MAIFIYKHVSNKYNKFLSFGDSGILFVVVIIFLCPRFWYRYIILVDPNGAGFLISNTVFLTGWKQFPTHIFTKFSQNVYLINTHIFIYRHARCNCKLWSVPWICCIFLTIFIHNCQLFMSEVLYLHQTVINCVFNITFHILQEEKSKNAQVDE